MKVNITPAVKAIIIEKLRGELYSALRNLQCHEVQLKDEIEKTKKREEEYLRLKDFPDTIREWVEKDKAKIHELRQVLADMGVNTDEIMKS